MHDFRDHVLAKIRDIEELGVLGKKMGICPYYASRATIKPSEVILPVFKSAAHRIFPLTDLPEARFEIRSFTEHSLPPLLSGMLEDPVWLILLFNDFSNMLPTGPSKLIYRLGHRLGPPRISFADTREARSRSRK